MQKILFPLLLLVSFSAQAQIIKSIGGGPDDTLRQEIGVKISRAGGRINVSSTSPVFKNLTEMRATPANLLDTGTIYFRNTSGIFVPYKWNANSTASDDSVTIIQRNGTSTGRFELFYQDAIYFDWWNPDRTGGTDVSYKLQKAIQFTLSNGKVGKLKISGGRYIVKNVGIFKKSTISPGEYDYATIVIEGSVPASDVNLGPGANTIFINPDNEAVTMWGQRLLNCHINNIYFKGAQPGPATIADAINFTESQWLKGTRNNQRSPGAAGFVIDPFSAKVPAADRYPALASFYTNKETGGSSTVVFNDCSFYELNIGLMVSPNGVTQNCDNIVWNGGFAQDTRILWASGQAQSRANHIQNVYSVGKTQYIINCVAYGAQQGSPPNVSNSSFAGGIKYFIYGNGNFGPLNVHDSEFESIWSLGVYNTQPIVFRGCAIRRLLADQANVGFAPVFAEGTNWHFMGGSIEHFTSDYSGAFNFNVQNLTFTAGAYLKGAVINRINSFNSIVFANAVYKNGLGEYKLTDDQTIEMVTLTDFNSSPMNKGVKYRTVLGTIYAGTGPGYELIDGDTKKITINKNNWSGSFVSANAYRYAVGDNIVATNNINWDNDIYRESPGFVGYVTAVEGNVVQLSNIPYGIDANATYNLKIHRIPLAHVRATGDITAGSNIIQNVRSEVAQHFSAGQFIKAGEALYIGTRVKSVDVAAGRIVLTTAAAASQTNAELYDAELKKTAYAYNAPAAESGNGGWFKGDEIVNNFSVVRTRDTAQWIVLQAGFFNMSQKPVTRAIVFANAANNNSSSSSTTLSSGTYTPTLTSIRNINSSASAVCQYIRVGDVVTVSGRFELKPNSAGSVEMGLSLPVNTSFPLASNAGGTASAADGTTCSLSADTGNGRIRIMTNAPDNSRRIYYFTATYKISGQ